MWGQSADNKLSNSGIVISFFFCLCLITLTLQKKVMRKLVQFLILLALSFSGVKAMSFTSMEDDAVVVPITKVDPASGSFHPHSPSQGQISCLYSRAVNCFEFVFFSDLGFLMITVLNEDTGEIFITTVNSSNGSATVPLFSNSGSYSIIINTCSGDQYYGALSL